MEDLKEKGYGMAILEGGTERSSGERIEAKGPTKNNVPFWGADPSRLTALFVGHISRYHSLLTPCQTGASTPEKGTLFLAGPLVRVGGESEDFRLYE